MKFGTEILTLIANFFGWNTESTEAEIHENLRNQEGTLEELRASIRTEVEAEFQARLDQSATELQAVQTGEAEVRNQLDRAQARIGELEAEVIELKKKPAEQHTNGSTETESTRTTRKIYDPNRSPITRKAIESMAD